MLFKNLVNSVKERQDKRRRKEVAKKTAVGLGVGAVLGTVAGLLFAPKEGKETRKDIAEGAKKASEEAKKAAGVIKDKVEGSYGSLKTKIKDLKKDGCGCCCCGDDEETQTSETDAGEGKK